MLSTLRRPDGGPGLHVRVLAALVVLGMLALAAPMVVGPVLQWLGSLLF